MVSFDRFLWPRLCCLCPLQGSRRSPSSGPRPRRKPGGRLCVWRRRRGGGQSRAPRAQRALAGGDLLPRHRRNDRGRGGESLRSVEEDRNQSYPTQWRGTVVSSCHYLSISLISKTLYLGSSLNFSRIPFSLTSFQGCFSLIKRSNSVSTRAIWSSTLEVKWSLLYSTLLSCAVIYFLPFKTVHRVTPNITLKH